MIYSKIIGVGSYLPETILTNADLEKLVETSDDWIVQRVGIRERHIVGKSKDTVSTMAAQAARRALEAAQLSPNDVDLIIACTATCDYLFPSAACIVQHELGMSNKCPAFDLNAACSGFIYGLSVADQFIKTKFVKNAIVIGVDALTKTIDWTDRGTCVLFGDGAGAVVLQQASEPGILTTHIHADGSFTDTLYAKNTLWHPESPYVFMKGSTVFKVAVTQLGSIVDETLAKCGLKKEDVDWLIPHQANSRIIEATAKRLNLSMEKVILTVGEHGNTSAASVPLALDHALKQGKIKRGEILMLEAFGAGLAWGSAVVKY